MFVAMLCALPKTIVSCACPFPSRKHLMIRNRHGSSVEGRISHLHGVDISQIKERGVR